MNSFSHHVVRYSSILKHCSIRLQNVPLNPLRQQFSSNQPNFAESDKSSGHDIAKAAQSAKQFAKEHLSTQNDTMAKEHREKDETTLDKLSAIKDTVIDRIKGGNNYPTDEAVYSDIDIHKKAQKDGQTSHHNAQKNQDSTNKSRGKSTNSDRETGGWNLGSHGKH